MDDLEVREENHPREWPTGAGEWPDAGSRVPSPPGGPNGSHRSPAMHSPRHSPRYLAAGLALLLVLFAPLALADQALRVVTWNPS